MPIEHLHTYLVYPNKGLENPRVINGASVPLEGKVFELLAEIYENTQNECKIDISFDLAADGAANNDCRTLLLGYVNGPEVATGLALAERLGAFTTNRSGLGLLFLAMGNEGHRRKIVVARFPANNGIIADENQQALNVQFIERVFMRSATSYKAVAYEDQVTAAAFWTGRAVDRQINSRETEISRYWIADFLASDFRTTSAQGTRRLAIAMRDAARHSNNLTIKQEITAAATLGGGAGDQVMTAEEFLARFGLSPAAREAVLGEMKHPGLHADQFRFSAEEFARQLPYKSVELDSGAILTAAAAEFDEVFQQDDANDDGAITFSATGRIVSEKLEKTR